MNREIKFRAWDIKNHEMIDVCDISFSRSGISYIKGWKNEFIRGGNFNLMQFTGLHDKNGLKELYEYDIINKDGLLIGNFYENEVLLEEKTNFLIKRMGCEEWKNTEQEANKRGCYYA